MKLKKVLNEFRDALNFLFEQRKDLDSGWISPEGEVIYLDSGVHHWESIEEDPDKFRVNLDDYNLIIDAIKNNWVRFSYSSSEVVFQIEDGYLRSRKVVEWLVEGAMDVYNKKTQKDVEEFSVIIETLRGDRYILNLEQFMFVDTFRELRRWEYGRVMWA